MPFSDWTAGECPGNTDYTQNSSFLLPADELTVGHCANHAPKNGQAE